MNDKLLEALEDNGLYLPKEYPEYYLIYGNIFNPARVLVFEKDCAFHSAIYSGAEGLSRNLILCTFGNPSNEFLKFISKYKTKKKLWLADLDPTSMFNYLSIKTLNEFPEPRNTFKIDIEWVGLSPKLCLENLNETTTSIKLSDLEGITLDYIKKFKAPELTNLIDFLDKGRKFEIEGFINCHKNGKDGFKTFLERLLK